ncbi:uncharacterized protein LOC120712570 isoform X2 [Panicum virgatum]|uniref:uncharacterized protein LOC120712570 isoform X2 n=1 Tax=Panicum virgatum TaxID=38727 RepID=UPI0019D65738|nr:uncharacterized protein LOC120712570 isoform X2 [Panicum virgatum]
MAASPPTQKPRLASVPDALASLPLEVLDNIFSRLHIYDVVRTSVLSRAWRRRWEALPTVDLSHSPGICASDVDALLLRRGSAPVRAFCLPARDPSWMAFNYFHDWLLRLSRRGVRDLTLGFPSRFGLFQLHSCLFSCRELTRLSLTNCRIPPAPAGLAGFPNLKTLRLEKVVVAAQEHAGKGFAALIAASPVLEDVEIVCVVLVGDDPDDEWVIRAPNLRKLSILGAFKYGGVTESLPLLEEAIFFGTNCAKFLTGMAGITKLDFSFISIWGWSDGIQEIETNSEFLNAQCADHIFAKLHVVHMKKFSYLINEMHFMEFVLLKARVLQVLYVTLDFYATCSNEEVVTEIAEYPRASSDAQVIFMGREPESANDESRGFITAEDSDGEMSIDKARPRRRQRLKSESVAQVEQLREELQNLKNEEVQILKDRLRLNEEISVLYKDLKKYVSYSNSALQLLCKGCNIACPHLDRSASHCAATRASSSDHAGTSKQGGTPVDTAINGSRVDPPENHAVGGPGNVHMDAPGDIINCADDAHPKSPEDHD